jgi:ribosomal protein L23
MNKMQVPIRVRRMRFLKPKADSEAIDIQIASFEYLSSMVKKVINSEKYILSTNLLVLDVSLDAEKLKIKRALEGISNAKITKITSSNRKPHTKYFKGRLGTQPGYKRMHITTTEPFDLALLFGGSE